MTVTSLAFWLINGISLAAPVNVDKSTLKWIGQKPTSEHWGSLQFDSGDIAIRKGQWIGGDFSVDMTSMTVDDFSGPQSDKLLRHLQNDDFFAVDKFDRATLRISSTKGNQVKADLTIKGQTHEVEFTYTKKDNAYEGRLTFDRTQYGITYKSKSAIKGLGDKFIKDNVHVDFKIILAE